MAGNRVLLDSGEFTSPANAKGRVAEHDHKELLQAKSDLATADRKYKAAEAQIGRLEKEYADLKQAYDQVYKELTVFRKKAAESKEVKKK